uniref:Uncharacterized protein n=1 Tax=Arundo donax TaxID=35708 RepID=A0A0A8ZPK3_ARUDO
MIRSKPIISRLCCLVLLGLG